MGASIIEESTVYFVKLQVHQKIKMSMSSLRNDFTSLCVVQLSRVIYPRNHIPVFLPDSDKCFFLFFSLNRPVTKKTITKNQMSANIFYCHFFLEREEDCLASFLF